MLEKLEGQGEGHGVGAERVPSWDGVLAGVGDVLRVHPGALGADGALEIGAVGELQGLVEAFGSLERNGVDGEWEAVGSCSRAGRGVRVSGRRRRSLRGYGILG